MDRAYGFRENGSKEGRGKTGTTRKPRRGAGLNSLLMAQVWRGSGEADALPLGRSGLDARDGRDGHAANGGEADLADLLRIGDALLDAIDHDAVVNLLDDGLTDLHLRFSLFTMGIVPDLLACTLLHGRIEVNPYFRLYSKKPDACAKRGRMQPCRDWRL